MKLPGRAFRQSLTHRAELAQDSRTDKLLFYKMMKQNADGSSGATHRCGLFCLGPLTFHTRAVGAMVSLSHGHRRAERCKDTFKNGLVFSSRPLRINERLCVRVEKNCFKWHGSLRVGFTNVSPSERSLPLPTMAIPDLTKTPGHWAAVLPECFCQKGSELEFWVSAGGNLYVSINKITLKVIEGVDLSRPLWAMIDVYGRTCSISLLGSKKHGLICRRSCPAPEPLPSPDYRHQLSVVPDVSGLDGDGDEDTVLHDGEFSADNRCVVCMMKEASVTLPCGHRCLCWQCNAKVCQEFGTCPLCRHPISTSYW